MIDISVISNELVLEDEHKWINWMFENGLQCFHLRKLNYTFYAYKSLLDKIHHEFHNKIIIHSYYKLIYEYELKGIHVSEKKRIHYIINNDFIKYANSFGLITGTSAHSSLKLEALLDKFHYIWVSPVFSSISKPNYNPSHYWIADAYTNGNKLVALGGINYLNLNKVKNRGFKQAAILGFLWNNPDNFKSNFLKLISNE